MFVRMVLVLLLLIGSAEAAFRHTKEIRLKKDETEKILLKHQDGAYVFEFRWTLYINGGLVIHRSYDGFNNQHILKLNHNNQSFRQPIDMSGKSPKDYAYIVVRFKSFDFEKREAVFDLLLRDDAEKVEMKYLNETDE